MFLKLEFHYFQSFKHWQQRGQETVDGFEVDVDGRPVGHGHAHPQHVRGKLRERSDQPWVWRTQFPRVCERKGIEVKQNSSFYCF
jgi:hypothetical protein